MSKKVSVFNSYDWKNVSVSYEIPSRKLYGRDFCAWVMRDRLSPEACKMMMTDRPSTPARAMLVRDFNSILFKMRAVGGEVCTRGLRGEQVALLVEFLLEHPSLGEALVETAASAEFSHEGC